ncbi:MAG: M15 family metallopeptidase [Myxococcales bacterium]|nr:M15 family metallopeptidase [Myxococcales bacterium]
MVRLLALAAVACAEPPPAVPDTAPEPVAPEPVVPEPPPAPVFTSSVRPLNDAERTAMTGVTWRPGCPVPLDDLVRVEVSHHDFEGGVRQGALVVRADTADAIVAALAAAFAEGFPIERMEPIVAFGGSDDASMDANNTSAFNCRAVTGGTRYSEHSYGHAVDVNPAQNPYISSSGRTVLPAAAADFVDREDHRPGMLFADSALVASLVGAGWGWGGAWSSTRDFQHLSANGR